MKILPVFVAGVLLAGCATSQVPVLYPNAKFKQVGDAAAQRDVDECRALADKAGASSGASSGAARGGLTGAAAGGAAAAVGSLIRGGNVVSDAAAGAAVGGAAGAAGGAVSGASDASVYHNFVGRCLGERGYEVIGWK